MFAALGAVAGLAFRAVRPARASWKGLIALGCATEVSDSGFLLKVGSFGFALGAEKNDESDLASFIAGAAGAAATTFFLAGVTLVLADDVDVGAVLLVDAVALPVACFFGAEPLGTVGSSALRFFLLSKKRFKVDQHRTPHFFHNDVTYPGPLSHPCPNWCCHSCRLRPACASSPRSLMPCP